MQAAIPFSKPLFSPHSGTVVRELCFGQVRVSWTEEPGSEVLVPPGSADSHSAARRPQAPCTKKDPEEPSAKNPPLLNSDSSQTSLALSGQQVVKKYYHILCGLSPQTGDFPTIYWSSS